MIMYRAQLCVLFCLLMIMLCGDKNNPVNDPPPSFDGTATDADGNVYKTVKIGNQVWTTENLRTTKFNDGTSIPHVTDQSAFGSLTSPGYCYYNNTTNSDIIKKSGALYNGYAVNTNKLAPKGWHVPSNDEWITLRDYLIKNGYNWDGTTSGNKIGKALAAKSDWKTNDTAGTIGNDQSTNNRSGFSALPSGDRYTDGGFGRFDETHYWSSTTGLSWFMESVSSSIAMHSHGITCGFSVRLVKD